MIAISHMSLSFSFLDITRKIDVYKLHVFLNFITIIYFLSIQLYSDCAEYFVIFTFLKIQNGRFGYFASLTGLSKISKSAILNF